MEIPDYDQDPATDEVMSFREAEAAAVEEHLESLAIGEAIHNLLVMAYSGASCGELISPRQTGRSRSRPESGC
jgi:hypothetical protein